MENNDKNIYDNAKNEYSQNTMPEQNSEHISNEEPTVAFNVAEKPAKKNSNTGLKVFFTMLAVTVTVIIAVSAGYLIGNKSTELPPNDNKNEITHLATKDESILLSNNAEVVKNVNQSVVSIVVYNDEGKTGMASGVIYNKDGYIVTNDHLYAQIPSPKFMVTLSDGREYKAIFYAGDTRSDLAVLKIEADNLVPAVFGDSNQILPGENVVAIGYPSGPNERAIVTAGSISNAGVRITSNATSFSTKMIQTDTAINPGNSGGGLFNMYSQVIGITSVKITGTVYDNVSYAIPSGTVVKVIDSLIANKYVADRGKLGVVYRDIDIIQSELNNLPTGLLIDSISNDSDLNGKHISKGDIITHINDVEIRNKNIALDIMDSIKPGESIAFTVYHQNTKTSETVYAALIPDQGNSSYKTKVSTESR